MTVPRRTVVHLLRHGEVDNPGGIIYGRLPGYRLSELGRQMAVRVADYLGANDIARVVSSPLERAQETAAPLARRLGLTVDVDERVIEAGNSFEGERFSTRALTTPRVWRRLTNPFRPSWGEPYEQLATRMLAAVEDARRAAEGRETVVVSHQLPIWIARQKLAGARLWHDPRRRECGLASLTTLTYAGADLESIAYSEPAGELVRRAATGAGA